MDNLITISNVKENVLEFDIEISGIESEDMDVRFVIESDSMDLSFGATRSENESWVAKVPALSMLETTSYPFHIEVVVDGYHFKPMQGSINVVGSHDIYATKPENITLTPAKKKPTAKTIVKKAKADVKKTNIVPPVEKEVTDANAAPLPVEGGDKRKHKFEMKPLKVKDSKELFKTLTDIPKPKRDKDDGLDDRIVSLMKQAKAEVKTKKETAKATIDKSDDKPTETAKEIASKLAKEEDTKAPSKEKDVPVKSTPKKKTPAKKRAKRIAPKKAPARKAVVKKDTVEKTTNAVGEKKKITAKSVAEKIIQSVTGLGKKSEVLIENKNDDKIKKIIINESTTTKKEPVKKAVGVKKIGKDNTITEVDKAKEQSIKDALKSVDDSETKTVTTKPFVKKDVTIH